MTTSFDLKKDLRSLWNSEPKTWFHFLVVFCCHSFFSLLFQDQQIYYNGNNFCAFDASFDLKKDLRSLWNSEPKDMVQHFLVGILLSFFFFLYYSKINKFITTAITFAHLTLVSIWKKIWEACEILNLKHGSISLWYSVVILFFSLLFQDQQIYYNGNNFCAFDE